ncbi:MAG: hypothetical protein AMJ42_02095 [Deltaproteobacteria bacterium DG_8]|nr:MAG: hypothetical protein AMJ42_02095 [Deltaproteobacteria bacterium DG_8]
MMRIRLLCAIILLLPILWIGCGGKGTRLRLKFNEGDEYRYRLIQDSVTTTEFMGKKMEMPSKTEITLTQKVERISQGVAELEIIYDSFDMEMSVGGKQIPSNMGKSMIGKTDKMKISENGEIIEPKGLKTMVGLQGLGSDIKNIFFNLYPKFPERKLKVGDIWAQKQETPQSQMEVVIESQYTLSRIEKKEGYNCAVIDSTFSMNIKGGEQAKMNIKGDGKGRGTTYFAYEKGFLINSQIEIDFNMFISAPLPTGEQEIPTSTHQKINLSLI